MRPAANPRAPAVPAPPRVPLLPPPSPTSIQPLETRYERHFVPGTGLELGWHERAILVGEELVQTHDVAHVRLGCGHHAGGFDPAMQQGQLLPGIGGQCQFCREEAARLLARGQIDAGQAEALSLCCTRCLRRCDGCGNTSLCSRHCLPFQGLDGRQVMLCPSCQTGAERKRLIGRVLEMLTAPFVEPEDP